MVAVVAVDMHAFWAEGTNYGVAFIESDGGHELVRAAGVPPQGLAAEQGLGRSRAGGFAVEIDLTAPILVGGLVVGIDGEALGQCVRAEQGRRVNEDGLVHRS